MVFAKIGHLEPEILRLLFAISKGFLFCRE